MLRTTTYRQYLAWEEYLAEEMNTPSRSDYYLMQLAAEVRRGHVKSPNQVRVEDFTLKFTAQPRKAPPPNDHVPSHPAPGQHGASGQGKATGTRNRLGLPPVPRTAVEAATANAKVAWGMRLALAGVTPVVTTPGTPLAKVAPPPVAVPTPSTQSNVSQPRRPRWDRRGAADGGREPDGE